MKWKICLVKAQLLNELDSWVCPFAGAACSHQAGHLLILFGNEIVADKGGLMSEQSVDGGLLDSCVSDQLTASLLLPINTTTCHFLLQQAPAKLGRMGGGGDTKGEMRNSALLHELGGKGQIILLGKLLHLRCGLSHGERACVDGGVWVLR